MEEIEAGQAHKRQHYRVIPGNDLSGSGACGICAEPDNLDPLQRPPLKPEGLGTQQALKKRSESD